MSGRNREKYNLYQKEYQKNIGYKYQKKWNEQYLKTDEGKRKNNERTKKNYKHKRDYYLSYHKLYGQFLEKRKIIILIIEVNSLIGKENTVKQKKENK